MPRAVYDVEIEDSIEVRSSRRGQWPKDSDQLYPRKVVAAFGTVNGKPFHASSLKDSGSLSSWFHSIRGIRLSDGEIGAIKRRMSVLHPLLSHDLRDVPFEDVDEAGIVAGLFEGRVLYFDVPDRTLNPVIRAEGGRWNDFDHCWNVILGADVERLAAAGIRPRPAPDVCKLEGTSQDMRQELIRAGAWWMGSLKAWFVDLATADRAALDELGVRTTESIADVLRNATQSLEPDPAVPPAPSP